MPRPLRHSFPRPGPAGTADLSSAALDPASRRPPEAAPCAMKRLLPW